MSSLDNLVFPVLPQPDTDKLLANLQAKQTPRAHAHLHPRLVSPHLPSVPLPETSISGVSTNSGQCVSAPVNIIKDTQVIKSPHQLKLLKIQRTNFQPSIGEDFQATLPDMRARSPLEDFKYGVVPHETLMWSPNLDKFSESQFEAFLKLSTSSAVRDNRNNVENALYTLLQCNGSISRATQRLLGFVKQEDATSRSSEWSAEDVDMFYEALCKHKKDFSKIAADLPNKSIKDCVEFYYLWKNICREESQSFKSIINDNSADADILAI